MMKRFRLYTESFDNLAELTARYFQGFTLFSSVGYWQGSPEKSTVIEILAETDKHIAALAELIRETNRQQAVMVSIEPVQILWALEPAEERRQG